MEKKKENKNLEVFSNAPVPQAVLKNVLPAMAAMIMVLIYNLADTFFIGQTHDDILIAAVSLAMPVFLLFTAVGTIFGVGGVSVISRALGEGRSDYAKKVCEKLGYELELKPIDWDAKDEMMKTGAIDFIWNGFTYEGRENDYEWTDRYLNNSIVVLTAENVSVERSDCPTQDCVHTGHISRSGQSIVCLPARVVIQLEGGTDSGVDAVIG